MIHFTLGRRLGVLLPVVVLAWAPAAHACRTTTCAVDPPPAGCVRDDVGTGCWTAGIPIYWPESCVAFSVDARGVPSLGLGYDDTQALVSSAFALWPTASCAEGFPSIAVKNAGPLECDQLEYNEKGPNSNAVLFRTDHWSHDPTAIGLTTMTFEVNTGRIVDADMELNLVGATLSQEDLAFVVTHEAGHFFGLDHSRHCETMMYYQGPVCPFSPGLRFGTATPTLTPEDVGELCAAYPTARVAPACDFRPKRGYSPVCGGDMVGRCAFAAGAPRGDLRFGLFALAASAALGWARRSRRIQRSR